MGRNLHEITHHKKTDGSFYRARSAPSNATLRMGRAVYHR